jgi:two-component system response regulator HydG
MVSGTKATVLLVDDEQNARTVYGGILASWGYRVLTAGGTLEALEVLRDQPGVDVALVDLRMPEPDGTVLFRRLRSDRPDLPVVILTAHGSIDSSVAAMKEGAFHYLTKPPDPGQLESIVGKAVDHVRMARDLRLLRERMVLEGADGEMIGTAPSFVEALRLAGAAARSEASILLTGETGTGKEVMARHIHRLSRRSQGPFVGINCGALPPTLLESELFGHERGAFSGAVAARPGRFEEVDGGTLFLDEVGDCTPDLQVKLLRVLEEREFSRVGSNRRLRSDFRLVAATHVDLARAVAREVFRQDLYFRIQVVEVGLPPLRERRDDIPSLAMHFIRKHARREGREVEGISPEALESLLAHRWPGNVRELENVIHRAVVLAGGGLITAADLPPGLGEAERPRPDSPPQGYSVCGERTLSEWERHILASTLSRCAGNKSRAARVLGISRKVLYAKMERHKIATG